MIPIKAVLLIPITYQDEYGKIRSVNPESIIEVYRIKEGQVYTDTNGRYYKHKLNSYIGIKGDSAFDLKPSEFKTID